MEKRKTLPELVNSLRTLAADLNEWADLLGGATAKTTVDSTGTVKKRTMSAAGRRRIAAASRKRWAEYHKQQKIAAKKSK